jgi:hypothetical protein
MVAPLMAPIRLTVPGTLRYRDVAVRIVAEAARLVSSSTQRDPEGGMGIHIAKTMLDEISYEPGPPNLWRLMKRLPGGASHAVNV